MDDEVYKKLTIWVRDPFPLAAKQTLRFPDQGVMVLSSGGSAWPRHDCSGHVTGMVEVTPLSSSLDVRVDGKFEPQGTRDDGDECPSQSVTLQFQAKQASLHELTPWHGGMGATHPYDETYAP